VEKPVCLAVLVHRLAVGLEPPGDSCWFREFLECVRLAVRVVPPSDDCNMGVSEALRA